MQRSCEFEQARFMTSTFIALCFVVQPAGSNARQFDRSQRRVDTRRVRQKGKYNISGFSLMQLHVMVVIQSYVIIIIIIKYNIYIAPYSQVLYGAVHCFYDYFFF